MHHIALPVRTSHAHHSSNKARRPDKMFAMRCAILLFIAAAALAQNPDSLGARAQRYLVELIRINTTNPPGNETRVAEYLKQATASGGIAAELLGNNPKRLNFVARLPSAARSETMRPLLLMAHSDVV